MFDYALLITIWMCAMIGFVARLVADRSVVRSPVMWCAVLATVSYCLISSTGFIAHGLFYTYSASAIGISLVTFWREEFLDLPWPGDADEGGMAGQAALPEVSSNSTGGTVVNLATVRDRRMLP